jgi:serine/threonine-protein kinase
MTLPHDLNSSDPRPEKSGGPGPYELQGEIARGAMAAVLRGRDVDLGRDIAIKILLEKHADRPEVVGHFIQEAQIVSQLQHPGIVPVYELSRTRDRRPYFTMKLVKGQTLAALLAERTDLAADRLRFLTIALLVAQTVSYAHAKGVIHRDLKPADIMISAFGEIQVMDWGLARVLPEPDRADEERTSQARPRPGSRPVGSREVETEPGSLLGTPAYMPPEQASGDMTLADFRADVFGLGGILCEILTGKPPYVGRSEDEVRRKAANADLADANARLEACSADGELIALTRACLSAEPSRRPKHAGEVAEALASYLDSIQHRLHEAEFGAVKARAIRAEKANRRLTLALAGTVLLALSLLAGTWLWAKTDRDVHQEQLIHAVSTTRNGIHDEAALANLSPEERTRLSNLLNDVAALLKKTETPTKKETKR